MVSYDAGRIFKLRDLRRTRQKESAKAFPGVQRTILREGNLVIFVTPQILRQLYGKILLCNRDVTAGEYLVVTSLLAPTPR